MHDAPPLSDFVHAWRRHDMVPARLVRLFGGSAGLLMSLYLEEWSMREDPQFSRVDAEGWIRISDAQIEALIGMRPHEVSIARVSLESQGVLECRRDLANELAVRLVGA